MYIFVFLLNITFLGSEKVRKPHSKKDTTRKDRKASQKQDRKDTSKTGQRKKMLLDEWSLGGNQSRWERAHSKPNRRHARFKASDVKSA